MEGSHKSTFLKSLDESVWKSVETGWKRPEKDMTTEETSACNANSKGLNAIFVVVSPELLKSSEKFLIL